MPTLTLRTGDGVVAHRFAVVRYHAVDALNVLKPHSSVQSPLKHVCGQPRIVLQKTSLSFNTGEQINNEDAIEFGGVDLKFLIGRS